MPTDPIIEEVPPFLPYAVAGIGTVEGHEADAYLVRVASGALHGYRSPSGTPSEELAAAEIAFGIAHPPAFPDPVPQVVRAAAMRYVLNAQGLRSTIEAAVAGADQNTKDAWEFETNIRYDHPLIAAFSAGLGLSTEQVDAIFRAAADL
jgi:hypothetical protein